MNDSSGALANADATSTGLDFLLKLAMKQQQQQQSHLQQFPYLQHLQQIHQLTQQQQQQQQQQTQIHQHHHQQQTQTQQAQQTQIQHLHLPHHQQQQQNQIQQAQQQQQQQQQHRQQNHHRRQYNPAATLLYLATNECRVIDYRGHRIAAFLSTPNPAMIAHMRPSGGLGAAGGPQQEMLLCLPQAFEVFLRHLVGGLHTVYTKLKRLEIVPIVCNVEQVRTLRNMGAIQPGVNRCKLLSTHDFDILFRDCTTARPGRPPKRSPVGDALSSASESPTREDSHNETPSPSRPSENASSRNNNISSVSQLDLDATNNNPLSAAINPNGPNAAAAAAAAAAANMYLSPNILNDVWLLLAMVQQQLNQQVGQAQHQQLVAGQNPQQIQQRLQAQLQLLQQQQQLAAISSVVGATAGAGAELGPGNNGAGNRLAGSGSASPRERPNNSASSTTSAERSPSPLAAAPPPPLSPDRDPE